MSLKTLVWSKIIYKDCISVDSPKSYIILGLSTVEDSEKQFLALFLCMDLFQNVQDLSLAHAVTFQVS